MDLVAKFKLRTATSSVSAAFALAASVFMGGCYLIFLLQLQGGAKKDINIV
jgi:hypothetical protein